MAVKIGIGLFTGQIPTGSARTFQREYRETIDLVRLAESLGFDSAWVSEHHGSSDGYFPSLLVMLGALAAATDRIELGTGLVLTPLHDPLRLAEDAATVDQLSGGRLILGLGLGWRAEEFRMFGVPLSDRGRRTDETIEILRKAWTGRRFSHEGESFRYDRVRVMPPAARPGGPPIYVGGYVPPALRRAGRLADGYIVDAGTVEELRATLVQVEQAARDAGRDPEAVDLALCQNVWVSTDREPWRQVRDGVAHQFGSYTAWEQGHDTREHDSLEPVADEEELRKGTVVGEPDEVVRTLRPLVQAFGGRREFHLIVRLHYPGMDLETAATATELFAEKVLPALKGE